MNRTEHLLECLGEEGGEVAKETSKANRFGLGDRLTVDPDGPRGTEGPTNAEKIRNELIDLLGVYQMLVLDGELPDIGLDSLPDEIQFEMAVKVRKVERFMQYAERVGSLEPAPSTYPTDEELAGLTDPVDEP